MHGLDGPVFSFGGFVLAPKERLLRRGRDPVRLTAKAFDVLAVLVRRAGHLVSKDELLSEVWPGSIVEEVSLTVNLSAIRKALDQAGGHPSMIETVPGHGYRFVAAVQRGPATSWAVDAPSEAYRAYLRGRNSLGARSKSTLRVSAAHFQRALGFEPELAAAHAGLADCQAALGSLSYGAPAETFPVAMRHARRALELDASLAEAHASLGFGKLYHEWDWQGAELAFRRAIDLDPDHAASHQWYSIHLQAVGRSDEALEEIRLAQRREPLSPSINTDLGFHLYYSGRYDEALRQLSFTLDLTSDFAPAQFWLGRTCQEVGRFEDALTAFRRVEQELGNWPVSLAARGFVSGVCGRIADAEAILAELRRLKQRSFVTSYGVALVHAALGNVDEAFRWLDEAYRERSNWLVWLRLDPRWKGLHDDHRFAELVARIGFLPPKNRASWI